MKLSLSELLMYSTIRIEVTLKNGGIGTGTGFFFAFCQNGDQCIPAIVTNHHVIENAVEGRLRFCTKEGEDVLQNNFYNFKITNFEAAWINHPEVDLSIMPIAKCIADAKAKGLELFYVSLDKETIPTQDKLNELFAIEDVIMAGYPDGIWDSVNNLPIMRKGITAIHPKFDFEGRKEILIDIACFNGSSGSPVVILNQASYPTRRALVAGSRLIFLGILRALTQHTILGDIQIVDVPLQKTPAAVSRIPNNIGVVIKSEQLLYFENILSKK